MTTTIFRKDKKSACIACDRRVTWVHTQTNMPLRWFDSKAFLKTVVIDDVIYGFAGVNALWKEFLQNYTTKDESEFVLDTIIQLAKKQRAQFFLLRYDGVQLKLFAYSPRTPTEPEIFLFSKDPSIQKRSYAIGSGKDSKEYKKHKLSSSAQLPILKIIAANEKGLKQAGMLDLDTRFAIGNLTDKESEQAFWACRNKGGDLFTGGEVTMSQNATKEQIMEQVAIMNLMDQQAKANGAVCASPINAANEAKQLNNMGINAVSSHTIEPSEKRNALYEKMQASFLSSIQ